MNTTLSTKQKVEIASLAKLIKQLSKQDLANNLGELENQYPEIMQEIKTKKPKLFENLPAVCVEAQSIAA